MHVLQVIIALVVQLFQDQLHLVQSLEMNVQLESIARYLLQVRLIVLLEHINLF